MNMQEQIDTLLGKIKQDYVNWCTAGGSKPLSGYFQDSINEWDGKMQVKTGQKYIKVIRENSVWGFIVNTDNDKVFKKGDILKAAGGMLLHEMPLVVTYMMMTTMYNGLVLFISNKGYMT